MKASGLALTLLLSSLVPMRATIADVTLFFSPTLGPGVQEEQHLEFLAQMCADACISFDDREAGPVDGTEWAEQGVTFLQPSGQGLSLYQRSSNLVPDSPPNSLWPVGPHEWLEMRLDPPRRAVGFWIVDSERNYGNDVVEFLAEDGTVIQSITMPAVGRVVNDRQGHFFVGLFSDEPVASVFVKETATDNELVGIDSVTAGNPCSVGKIPGDCNDDDSIDISDAVCLLDFMFTGGVSNLPCGDLGPDDPANIALLDYSPDGAINISDPIALLHYLFLAGPPHPLHSLADEPGCDGKSGLVFFEGCF